jgi:hypothetical protein
MANGDPNDSIATARALTTTLVDFLRKEETVCFRRTPIGAEMSKRGRVTHNVSGLGFQWEVRNKLHPIFGNDGTTPLTFPQQNQWRNASLPIRGFGVTDSMFTREFKTNRGAPALVKVFNSMGKRMRDSMQEAYKLMWTRDGSSASDKLPMGIETFLGDSAFTVDTSITTGPAPRAENAGDLVMWPTGSYAGLSMALGNDGGSYLSTITSGSGTTFNWPMGKCDPQFDYWAPIVANAKTTNANIVGTADTWKGANVELIRFVKTYLSRNDNDGPDANLCTMSSEWFRQLCDSLDSKERSIVTVGEGGPGTRSYGHGDHVYVDTLKCCWDYGIDTNAAYIWNLERMEVKSMDDELFPIQGPEYDMPSQSYRWASVALMNVFFESPAKFGAIKELT